MTAILPPLVSACCAARLQVRQGDDFVAASRSIERRLAAQGATCYYVCTACGEACDAKVVSA